MEFNSRLDEKPISCGKYQGPQSVTQDFLFLGCAFVSNTKISIFVVTI